MMLFSEYWLTKANHSAGILQVLSQGPEIDFYSLPFFLETYQTKTKSTKDIRDAASKVANIPLKPNSPKWFKGKTKTTKVSRKINQ